MLHISTFYSWLDINEDTPIKIKLLVLYNCLFATILYSCEVWGYIDTQLVNKIVNIEKKALKACLCIKKSTPDDIVYTELNIGDIKSTILDRQYNFIQRFLQNDTTTTISKNIWNLYQNIINENDPNNILSYYMNLQNNNKIRNKEERKSRLMQSSTTMITRYKQLFNLNYCSVLYDSYVNEHDRIIITRWRLSCHKLKIETGRYTIPPLPKEERLCIACLTIEDEQHVIFECIYNVLIRERHKKILDRYKSTSELLQPKNEEETVLIARLLKEIEGNRLRMKLKFFFISFLIFSSF